MQAFYTTIMQAFYIRIMTSRRRETFQPVTVDEATLCP
jgi:hypothetical protein